jgi:hypothetical protein
MGRSPSRTYGLLLMPYQLCSSFSPGSEPDARLRWSDYTRGIPVKQLDDGIGNTFVSEPAE